MLWQVVWLTAQGLQRETSEGQGKCGTGKSHVSSVSEVGTRDEALCVSY